MLFFHWVLVTQVYSVSENSLYFYDRNPFLYVCHIFKTRWAMRMQWFLVLISASTCCRVWGLEWYIRNRVHFADMKTINGLQEPDPGWSPNANMLSAIWPASSQLCARASSWGGWHPRYTESAPSYRSFVLQLLNTVANQHSFYTWETSFHT